MGVPRLEFRRVLLGSLHGMMAGVSSEAGQEGRGLGSRRLKHTAVLAATSETRPARNQLAHYRDNNEQTDQSNPLLNSLLVPGKLIFHCHNALRTASYISGTLCILSRLHYPGQQDRAVIAIDNNR
ncbi:MAG TPA: hypothetical protein VNE82_03730 [Candidatus Binataceae bacterium]|nr:hypothetical protein [Candidatus Binataceae bacterium]